MQAHAPRSLPRLRALSTCNDTSLRAAATARAVDAMRGDAAAYICLRTTKEQTDTSRPPAQTARRQDWRLLRHPLALLRPHTRRQQRARRRRPSGRRQHGARTTAGWATATKGPPAEAVTKHAAAGVVMLAVGLSPARGTCVDSVRELLQRLSCYRCCVFPMGVELLSVSTVAVGPGDGLRITLSYDVDAAGGGEGGQWC